MQNRFEKRAQKFEVNDRVVILNSEIKKFKKRPLGMPKYTTPSTILKIDQMIATVALNCQMLLHNPKSPIRWNLKAPIRRNPKGESANAMKKIVPVKMN